MYNASTEFHKAVFENSPAERVLFRFADGTVFTNEDINQSSGLKFTEAANLEDELTIGACPSSTIETTFMNYHELLSGFAFGECEVSLGVRTAVDTGTAFTANAKIILRYGGASPVEITGHSTAPYLKVNGEPANIQPTFAVRALVADGYVVYAIGANGEIWAATWTDGQTWNAVATETWNSIADSTWNDIQGKIVLKTIATPNDFMVDKFVKWAAAGRGIAYNAGTLYEFYSNGTIEKYEYVPLGVFNIDTPAKRKVKMIATTAYDRMIKFDREADTFLAGLTYPITLGGIYTALCAFVGVTSATTTFINSTRSFNEAPATAENITAREVLGWIAEAACSFARFTRDGELELAWFGEEAVTILANQHFNADVSEYEVAAIDKLQIKNTENDIGVIIGTGTNAYVILDNPFLYGNSDTEIRTYGTPIYNRLSAMAAFAPVNAVAVCDWSIQAGDIISITPAETAYTFPVYLQTITWKGGARVAYECTGEASRPVVDAVNRRVYNQKRAVHELNVTVDGLESRITDAEGNISSVEQYAESLTLSVTNDTSSSTIKLMADDLEISSQSISFSGVVKFTDLSTAGLTTINGSNITTGYISASRISTGTLTSVSIVNSSITLNTNTITFTSTSGTINSLLNGVTYNIVKSLGYGGLEIGGYLDNPFNGVYIPEKIVSLGHGETDSDIYLNGYVACNGILEHNGTAVGFFGASPSAQRNCAQLSGTITLDMAKAKINEIIEDLGAYGLLNY